MVDYLCPDGGSIDEGIARDAFIETIVDLAQIGEINLDALNFDQMRTVFELYVTHTIENRLYNDIGTQIIRIPPDIRMALRIQNQIRDFIRRGVADALTKMKDAMRQLTREGVGKFVDRVYEDAFGILLNLSETEAEAI